MIILSGVMVNISKEESSALNALRLCCVLTVVMIHSSLNVPDIASAIGESDMKITSMWYHIYCLFPSLQLLFLISGYLFFRGIHDQYNWKRDYLKKIQGRYVALFLFYIVYCILSLVFRIVVKHHPIPSFFEFLQGFWPLDPMQRPVGAGMWYVRSLIAFTFLSPIYYIVIKHLRNFCIPAFMVLSKCPLPIDFAYFNCWLFLGAYLAYSGITLSSIAQHFDWRITLPLAITVHVVTKLWHLPSPFLLEEFLFLVGCIGLFSHVRIAPILTASSTFIYAFHFFIIGAAKHLYFRFLPHETWAYNLNILLTWATAVLLCFILFLVIRRLKYLPILLMGGRG